MAAKKTRKKAGKKSANVLDFAREYLRKRPKAPFADVRDAAKKKGLTLYPISYGRAQALEGIVKVARYGTKKKAKAKKTAGRGPGRPKGSRTRTRAAAGDGVEGLVQTIQNLQRQRDEAVEALNEIRQILARV